VGRNFARFVFLDPRAEEFFADWERAAKDVAALLRLEAGRNPFDRELSDLVGELSTRSEEFRGRWATHNVRLHTKVEKRSGRLAEAKGGGPSLTQLVNM
jgi:hypothetical protein